MLEGHEAATAEATRETPAKGAEAPPAAKGKSFADLLPVIQAVAGFGFLGDKASRIVNGLNAVDPLIQQMTEKSILQHLHSVFQGQDGEKKYSDIAKNLQEAINIRTEAAFKALPAKHQDFLLKFGENLASAVGPHIEKISTAVKGSEGLSTALKVAKAAVSGKHEEAEIPGGSNLGRKEETGKGQTVGA